MPQQKMAKPQNMLLPIGRVLPIQQKNSETISIYHTQAYIGDK
jgi:hypothetical protein